MGWVIPICLYNTELAYDGIFRLGFKFKLFNVPLLISDEVFRLWKLWSYHFTQLIYKFVNFGSGSLINDEFILLASL